MKRRTFLGLSSAAAAATLAGCGKSDKTTTSSDLSTLTVMAPVLDVQAPSKDGLLQKAIQEYAGRTLDITWVPNANYTDRLTVTLAGNQLPHLMVVTSKSPTFVRSALAGAFWDLTDTLKAYPNLVAANPDITKNASVNGKSFGVFRLRDPMRTSVTYRNDWLKKLGLQLPKTTDDLYEVAKAFKSLSGGAIIIPKFNGYGNGSPFDIIETWFGAPNGWGERGGKLVPSFDTDEYLEADRWIKKLVDEKLINADFATMDPTKWNDPFVQGKGGIILDTFSRTTQIYGLFKALDATDYGRSVDFTGNLAGPHGMHSYPTIGYNGFIAVSKQSVKTAADLDTVLKFLDTMSAKKGQVLENNGIEGTSFTVDGSYAVFTKGGDADVVNNDVKSFAQLGTNPNGNLYYVTKPANATEQAVYERRLKTQEGDMTSAVQNPANALVSDTYMSKGAQLDQIIGDARLKYFAGQYTQDQYTAEIKRWHTAGGDQVITEMNELYAK